MELVETSINNNLKNLILKAYHKIEKTLNQQNDRTHHLNFYHCNWDVKNDLSVQILKNLEKEYNIKSKDVLSFGFISSQPECKDQHFHIDYKGVTHTYFIPLCDITDKNGTDYLEFKSSVKNISLFKDLKKIGDRFITREGVSGYLNSINVDPNEYTFKILNSPAFSLVYLPNYVLHRGTKNREEYIKVMFQIIMKAFPEAKVSDKVEYKDSELDEDDDVIEILLSNRNKEDLI